MMWGWRAYRPEEDTCERISVVEMRVIRVRRQMGMSAGGGQSGGTHVVTFFVVSACRR
jgi:hypothetical protein